jgi:VCBS repeat-containing protein
VSFQLEVSDIETPENLSFVLVSSPEKGSIKSEITVNAQKRAFLSITFAPSLDAVGADEFSYQLSDGSAVSILRTTAVSITPVNDPPIAPNFVVNGGSGASINITVQAQDPDAGDVLYYDVNAQKQPLLGSVTVDGDPTAGKFTYTVRPGTPANAVDSFGYIVRDRLTGGLNASGTITVNIARQNNAPVANAGSVNGTEDTDRPFNLSASDPDGDPLVYRIVAGQGPANGEIVNFNSSTGAGIYRPRTNFSGNDTFKFEVTDGIATSSSATVSVTVSAVNDAPTIRQVGIFSVAEDQNATEVPLALSDVDNSNQVFTLEVVQQSSPNLVTIEGQKFFYRPKLDFNGIDSFIVRISDGQLKSEDLPVFVFVTATNDDPVAAAATYNILEDRTLAESLPATDIDSTALSATIVQQPTSGNVTITPNSLSFQYTPPANFSGSATFSYRVTDGSAQSNTAVVTIIVGEINDPPTASNVNASGNEDTDIAGSFAATDPDTPQANLSFLISRQPNNGTVVVSGKNFSYRGKQDFNGADSFEFVASDGQAFSAAATVSVNVTPINDPPVLPYSMPFRTPEDMAQDFEIKVVDPDDATVTLTLELVSRSAIGGALTINQATVSYSPTTNFFGEFKFSLQAKDPTGATSAVQNYSILVEPVNDAPVVPAKLEFNASEGRALAGQLSAVDVDRDSLQFVATSSPSSGTVVINQASGMFTYTPNANFNGTDQFRYRVTDGLAFSNEGLVEISVVPVNDPPTGTPQDLQLDEDTFIEFSLQGVDPEGGALQFFTLPPANGQLTRIGVGTNMFRYNPNLNFNGKDSFHFVVSDGVNQSSPAKVEIDVKPINDPPSIENFEARGPKNQEIRFKPVVSDVDGDTLTLVIKTQGERGEASIDGEFVVYDPSPGFTGTDTVKITVSDGTVEGNVADGIFIVEDPNP